MNPFFSIIIPAYNREHLIEDTIRSVINQTYTNWECVVVDDGSTDNTKNVILSLSENDNRIKYIYQKNAERSAARNNGVKNALGEYICFLDSDDFYTNDHLSNLFEKINSNIAPCLLVTSFVKTINGKDYSVKIDSLESFESKTKYIFFSGIIPSRVCGNKLIFQKYQFDEDITIVEDSILWSRILREFPIIELQETTVKYVLHDSNSINLNSKTAWKKLAGLYKMSNRYKNIWKDLSFNDRSKIISDAQFKLAQSLIFESKKLRASFWLLRSLSTRFFDTNTKHRIYTLIRTISGFKVQEYSKN
ncbi:MAG: glycosyltransferase [Crocinitomicaceae bacterium]|nr:glycosyltransferase [Crocinitomicaceae bacterium]MCF8409952.1 glycosyltransferase [Crocinitomicaceae bacterium]MCF8444648.1 glycosyltransferase [Crocinitomicaceae bacterium]